MTFPTRLLHDLNRCRNSSYFQCSFFFTSTQSNCLSFSEIPHLMQHILFSLFLSFSGHPSHAFQFVNINRTGFTGQDKCKFFRNRKGGMNLFYDGFVYRKKAKYRNTINWVCAKAPIRDAENRLILCHGRCVTDEDGFVRLGKRSHNHAAVDLCHEQVKYELIDEVNYRNLYIEWESSSRNYKM